MIISLQGEGAMMIMKKNKTCGESIAACRPVLEAIERFSKVYGNFFPLREAWGFWINNWKTIVAVKNAKCKNVPLLLLLLHYY